APWPATARNRALADRLVVVGELFAAADVPGGLDPDGLVDHLETAVRRAGMVDEPRDVAIDVRVAAPGAVDAEHPQLAAFAITLLARLALLVIPNQLARVVDDAGVLRDRFRREDTVAVNARASLNDSWETSDARHSRDYYRRLGDQEDGRPMFSA